MPTPEKHALLSASSAARWLHCTAAPRFEEQFPENTSEYAEEGRLAHAICELKVIKHFTSQIKPRTYTTRLKKLKENPLYGDEMDKTSDLYLEHLTERAMQYNAKPNVAAEVQVDFAEYVPEGFGTCDCIMIGGDTLSITDYKHGKGVPVSAEKMVEGALELGATVRNTLTTEAVRISGLDNPNSVAQLSAWLEKETDEEITDLRKDTVSKMLTAGDNSPEVQRMLEIRQELGKTSTKKYDAIEQAVCRDKWGADYFLSVHRNSASPDATGNEIWIYSKASETTYAKAENILTAVTRATGLKSRGVKRGAVSYSDFGINRYTNMHSALLELGFITSRKDNEALDKNFEALALELAKMLMSLVGAEYVEPVIKGDVNGDGKITAADARKALRASARLENLNEKEKSAADINGDGKVTADDARTILRKSARLE